MNVRRLVLGCLFLASFAASPCLAGPADAFAPCVPGQTTLCLNSSRFRVETLWATSDGTAGGGHAVALSADTGYFWFFSAGNIEMVVKVVDGRAVNGNFWVFAGGLTNVNVILTVTDTETGLVKVYVNPQGAAFQPIQDTGPFGSPPAFDLTGTWSGPANDDSGPINMNWKLTQNGNSITGTFFGVEPPPRLTQYRGTIVGNISGSSLTFTIDIPKGSIVGLPNCSVLSSGAALARTTTIVGTYTGVDCTGPFENGLMTLTKQP